MNLKLVDILIENTGNYQAEFSFSFHFFFLFISVIPELFRQVATQVFIFNIYTFFVTKLNVVHIFEGEGAKVFVLPYCKKIIKEICQLIIKISVHRKCLNIYCKLLLRCLDLNECVKKIKNKQTKMKLHYMWQKIVRSNCYILSFFFFFMSKAYYTYLVLQVSFLNCKTFGMIFQKTNMVRFEL